MVAKLLIDIIKKHASARLVGNTLSLGGTQVKQLGDILADIFLIIPIRTEIGFVSLGAYLQAQEICDRYSKELHSLKEIHMRGHSLGAGVGLLVAYRLYLQGYFGKIDGNFSGGAKVLSKKVANYLGARMTVVWKVRHRDIVPFLGPWKEPVHDTERTGTPKKHFLDYDVAEHTMY